MCVPCCLGITDVQGVWSLLHDSVNYHKIRFFL